MPSRARIVLANSRSLPLRGDPLNLRHELDRMHLGTFSGPAGTSRQRTETTHGQRAILKALDLPEPPRFVHLQPAPGGGS
jgi:hypothetical protein